MKKKQAPSPFNNYDAFACGCFAEFAGSCYADFAGCCFVDFAGCCFADFAHMLSVLMTENTYHVLYDSLRQ